MGCKPASTLDAGEFHNVLIRLKRHTIVLVKLRRRIAEQRLLSVDAMLVSKR
jgi:hypothetical protein